MIQKTARRKGVFLSEVGYSLIIIRSDITKMQVDAIVSLNNKYLNPGIRDECIHTRIHAFSVPKLYKAVVEIGTCPSDSIVITPSSGIKMCKYTIYCVGPVNYNDHMRESELLENCYRITRTGCE